MRRTRCGEKLVATVQLAAGFDPQSMMLSLQELGAELRGWSDKSRLLTLSIPPSKLEELSRLRGVTYVDVGSKMSPPSGPPRR